MTAGTASKPPHHPPPNHSQSTREYIHHGSAKWTNTDLTMADVLRAEYPQLHLSIVPAYEVNILAYAAAGHVGLAPVDLEQDRLIWKGYAPPARRLDGGRGALFQDVKYGKFLLDWKNKEFVLYLIEGHNGNSDFGTTYNQYILSPSVEATNQLLVEAGIYNNQLHNEVWVFDGGFWSKSRELWDAVQKASWDDVILEQSMKKAIISDVNTFFDSQDSYERLRVPWKRGIIYYGPPGNGKTISIKAMMHSLYAREKPIPTLYVKTLSSFGGPEYSINQIFTRARREAPCYLVFEDLDSIVTDEIRSYFLNAVDGIQRNDGILMVGSTNHLERLDPGIAKRPSRFDRKYLFPNPNEAERTKYMQYWQDKLSDNKDVEFPDVICGATAKITRGFSFAYLQEAMIASLLALARHDDDDDDDSNEDGSSDHKNGSGQSGICLECMTMHPRPLNGSTCESEAVRPFKGLFDWVWQVRQLDADNSDLNKYVLWREIKKQVRILREELGEDKDKSPRS